MSAICQQPKSVATFKPRHFSYWGGHNKRRENTNVSRYNLEGGRSRYKMTSEIRLQTLLFSRSQHLTVNQIVFFSTSLCSPPIFAISSAWYFWICFQSISYTQGCTMCNAHIISHGVFYRRIVCRASGQRRCVFYSDDLNFIQSAPTLGRPSHKCLQPWCQMHQWQICSCVDFLMLSCHKGQMCWQCQFVCLERLTLEM